MRPQSRSSALQRAPGRIWYQSAFKSWLHHCFVALAKCSPSLETWFLFKQGGLSLSGTVGREVSTRHKAEKRPCQRQCWWHRCPLLRTLQLAVTASLGRISAPQGESSHSGKVMLIHCPSACSIPLLKGPKFWLRRLSSLPINATQINACVQELYQILEPIVATQLRNNDITTGIFPSRDHGPEICSGRQGNPNCS